MNGVEWWKMVWWCLGWMGGAARSVWRVRNIWRMVKDVCDREQGMISGEISVYGGWLKKLECLQGSF